MRQDSSNNRDLEARAGPAASRPTGWVDAVTIASLFAVDPVGTGGVVVKALAGPARDAWLEICFGLMPQDCPVRRIPVQISDDRLLGGLDLSATLRAGRPVHEAGLLAEIDGGVAVLAMAERTRMSLAAQIASVIDERMLRIERDGISTRIPTRFGVIALDEGLTPEERVPDLIADRLAFKVDLTAIRLRDLEDAPLSRSDIARARAILPSVKSGDDVIEALVGAAASLGITSVRAVLLALNAARIAAALAGRDTLSEDDAMLAGRLVLAPRATMVPQAPPDHQDLPQEEDEPAPDEAGNENQHPETDSASNEADDAERDENKAEPPDEFEPTLEDLILAVAEAHIPAGLLNDLNALNAATRDRRSGGAAGGVSRSNRRGRPCGTLRGSPGGGVRISVIDTLRAAAPWQKIRTREDDKDVLPGRRSRPPRIKVRGEDFRVVPLRRAFTNRDHLRRRCIGLHRLAPPCRSQRRCPAPPGGLLHTPRFRGADRNARALRRSRASAHQVARPRQTLPCRPPRRRRYADGDGHRAGDSAGRSRAPPRSRPDRRAPD